VRARSGDLTVQRLAGERGGEARGHRGELRILSRGGPLNLAGLCDLLLPDLIRRTAEWHRLRVASAWAETGAAS